MTDQNEARLVKRAKQGDMHAFEELIIQHEKIVYNVALRMMNHSEDAKDISQEVFLKAYRNIGNFDERSQFSTWIYRIAYNTATSALRKKEHELLSFNDRMWNSLSDTEVDETLNTDDEVQIEKLQRALTRLTSDEKALVTLFYEEEKPVTEIAYILHLTENNVKVKLHRVRKKLCTLMKEED